MKVKKVEILIIAVSFLFLSFTIGYFVGRSSVKSVVSVETQISDTQDGQENTSLPDHAESDDNIDAAEPNDEENGENTPADYEKVKVNINTAGVEELDTLSGIGEVLAGRIVEYREQNGSFKEIQEIMNVRGIGNKIFEDIKENIVV